MKLKDITINNYRGISSLRIPLDELTVLIGENNAGKSTVLEALRLVLTRGFGSRKDSRFAEYDFHLKDTAATPLTADPIGILLHFSEDHEDDWPEAISQQLSEVIQIDMTNGTNHIWLKATGTYQSVTTLFETRWSFLNTDGAELALKNANTHNLLVKFAPLFFLSAMRDASQEFGQRGQFWNSFLKTIELPPEQLREIEEKLQEVNASVIDANSDLGEVINRIGEVRKFVPLAAPDTVILEAIPTRLFDLTGKVQVHLKAQHGAKLPLHRHGEGTQNLAVLMLFQAFTALNLAEAYAPESTPLLALEEPEAHLHPSAIRSLGTLLKNITGQRLVTSHSGDLVSRIPITSLRRLYKQNGETKVGQVSTNLLDARELQAVDYHVKSNKGHYLFSRSWLLVEGESDFHIMQRLLEYLENSQDDLSLSILEMSQVRGKGEPFFKIANALGIQWFLMVDGDSAGKDYARRVASHLQPGETTTDRASCWVYGSIEKEFWFNGFQPFIESKVSAASKKDIGEQANGDQTKELNGIIKSAITSCGQKPGFAEALFEEIKSRGNMSIPQSIKDVITRVVQLAGG